ncbi:MAG: hypothetical protein EKK57_04105 [Proteobacteria bacterium]|nr:MAG: hypothetical protein EKK57_04105 [Pseudomonadota bacterium]
MSIYTKFPHKKLHKRVRHLNNRDLAILFGVFLGGIVATYGIISEHFSSIAVLGTALGNHHWSFKILAILLSAGTFGNLLSYVGSCIDIITNHKTIFDLFSGTEPDINSEDKPETGE